MKSSLSNMETFPNKCVCVCDMVLFFKKKIALLGFFPLLNHLTGTQPNTWELMPPVRSLNNPFTFQMHFMSLTSEPRLLVPLSKVTSLGKVNSSSDISELQLFCFFHLQQEECYSDYFLMPHRGEKTLQMQFSCT